MTSKIQPKRLSPLAESKLNILAETSSVIEPKETIIRERKKGETKYHLSEEEELKYLSYKPEHPEYLDWTNIKNSSSFAIKQYKNSLYIG